VDEILEAARKVAQSAEVFRVTSTRTPVQFEANRLKQIQTKESVSTALRIVKNGKMGFAQAGGRIKADELVNMALETSEFGYELNFAFPAAQPYVPLELYDAGVEDVDIDRMVGLGQEIIQAVNDFTPGILCEGSVSRSSSTLSIANTSGTQASYRRTGFAVSIDGMLVRDGDILYVGDILTSCHPVLDTGPITREMTRQLELARNNATIGSGTFPVIFTPYGVAGALVTPLVSALNGKTVYDGASPLKDKKGTKVFDEKFTLHDDPTLPFQTGSTPFDDEGVATRKTALIDRGTVVQFYYDLHTAALAGAKSTGHGNRNGGMPSPSPHALVIAGGNSPLKSMIEDIKEGLIIEQLMGAEQGNILNGDFSGNVLLGYKIENGAITGRVKDTMVFGNVYQLLKQINAIGDDSRWITGSISTPSIYCPAISVSAKK
jgi:PmbA protein